MFIQLFIPFNSNCYMMMMVLLCCRMLMPWGTSRARRTRARPRLIQISSGVLNWMKLCSFICSRCMLATLPGVIHTTDRWCGDTLRTRLLPKSRRYPFSFEEWFVLVPPPSVFLWIVFRIWLNDTFFLYSSFRRHFTGQLSMVTRILWNWLPELMVGMSTLER